MIDPDQDYCLSECSSCFVHHEVPGASVAEKKGWGQCGSWALNPASLQGQQVSTPDCSPAPRTVFDFIFSNLFCFLKSIEASKYPKTHMLYQGQSELGDTGQGGPGEPGRRLVSMSSLCPTGLQLCRRGAACLALRFLWVNAETENWSSILFLVFFT